MSDRGRTTDGRGDVTMADDETLPPGLVLGGRYEILRRIGEGGMGVVFEARHQLLDKRVAVKVLHPERYGDRNAAERMLREARAAAAASHPNIVAVTDMGWDEDVLFFVMELVPGETLDHMIKRGATTVEQATVIVDQMLRALGAMHAQGIVHRDLKPPNVIISRDDEGGLLVKVLDFGIAKDMQGPAEQELTRAGAIMGTPAYMSPEQANTGKVDPRSDLYSAGVILYTLLAGAPPFEGPTPLATLARVIQGEHRALDEVRPGLPAHLRDVVASAMALDAGDRPADAAAMREALRAPDRIAAPADLPTTAALRPEDFDDIELEDERGQTAMAAPLMTPVTTGDGSDDGLSDAPLELDMSAIPDASQEGAPRRRPSGARGLGVALAVAGVLGLLMAAFMFRDKIAGPTPTVKLEVISTPGDASVWIDGEPHLERPIVVEQGDEHVRVRVEAPGFQARTVQVQPSRDRTLEVHLERE